MPPAPNPFAPPQSVATITETLSPDERTLGHARSRAWRAFALWVGGYETESGALTTILEGPEVVKSVGKEWLSTIIVRIVIAAAPPRIAVLSACFASLTFAFHHRGPDQRAEALKTLAP